MTLIVLRPEPGAGETLARARALGLEARAFPLFTVRSVAHDVPAADAFDALFVTSANGARHGADVLAALAHLPVYVVGEGSARAVGARPVTVGGGDAARTIPLIVAAGHRRVLHIGGEDRAPFDPRGLDVTPLTVYRAEPADAAPLRAALAEMPRAVILVHSPRAGRRLDEIIDTADRQRFALVAISAAAARACGEGWAAREIAPRMTDKAMLALAAQLCQYE